MSFFPSILFIEDNPEALNLIVDHFKLRRFEVYSAATGRAGIDLALDKKPTLVVLDFNLPDMTGDVVLIQIKKLLPQTKVLIFTGLEDFKLQRRLLELGAEGYLVKGDISILDLEKEVKRLLAADQPNLS